MDAYETIQHYGEILLQWIGFGTLVGLLAKALMPGRDPGGAVTTVLLGIGGTVVGCGVVAFFWPEQWAAGKITPVGPLGFLAATAGAFILLTFYRLLGGLFFEEGFEGRVYRRRRRYSYRRRPSTVVVDDGE